VIAIIHFATHGRESEHRLRQRCAFSTIPNWLPTFSGRARYSSVAESLRGKVTIITASHHAVRQNGFARDGSGARQSRNGRAGQSVAGANHANRRGSCPLGSGTSQSKTGGPRLCPTTLPPICDSGSPYSRDGFDSRRCLAGLPVSHCSRHGESSRRSRHLMGHGASRSPILAPAPKVSQSPLREARSRGQRWCAGPVSLSG